jgi:glycosyltransferase involved in cell wall biosynthesis
MVSVIIPSYNSEKTISGCLTSLSDQSYKSDFVIILVDSSKDKTPSIVRSQFPGILYYQFEKKIDPGTARNYGVKHSTGDLILFIDSDCVAEKDWISRHVQFHNDHPEVAAIGGSVINGNHSKDIVGWSSYFGEFREFLPQNPENFTFHIPTLNISYKRWIFKKYGFFDPNFYPQEDLVFNYSITEKGEKDISIGVV